jgi:hypothetical protein
MCGDRNLLRQIKFQIPSIEVLLDFFWVFMVVFLCKSLLGVSDPCTVELQAIEPSEGLWRDPGLERFRGPVAFVQITLTTSEPGLISRLRVHQVEQTQSVAPAAQTLRRAWPTANQSGEAERQSARSIVHKPIRGSRPRAKAQPRAMRVCSWEEI